MVNHTGLKAYAEQEQGNLLGDEGIFDELEERTVIEHNGIKVLGS